MGIEEFLMIENRRGSVEHYYHFLLGFLVPLVKYFTTRRLSGDSGGLLQIRDCGPMNRHLRALPIPLKIAHANPVKAAHDGVTAKRLLGFDQKRFYSYAEFVRFRNFILSAAGPEPHAGSSTEAILVEREPPDPHYLSEHTEVKSSGSSRRAIANHTEVYSALKQANPSLRNVRLAGMELYAQCRLFNTANLVIAQHGAALANILFMKEGSVVVEIVHRPAKKSVYRKLAATMKLRYFSFRVDSPFPQVDCARLVELVNQIAHGGRDKAAQDAGIVVDWRRSGADRPASAREDHAHAAAPGH